MKLACFGASLLAAGFILAARPEVARAQQCFIFCDSENTLFCEEDEHTSYHFPNGSLWDGVNHDGDCAPGNVCSVEHPLVGPIVDPAGAEWIVLDKRGQLVATNRQNVCLSPWYQ
jgi:hypothetical protein